MRVPFRTASRQTWTLDPSPTFCPSSPSVHPGFIFPAIRVIEGLRPQSSSVTRGSHCSWYFCQVRGGPSMLPQACATYCLLLGLGA